MARHRRRLCRAVAAALFGDAKKNRYTPLTAQQRFTALQSGEVDILSRNTTWTFARDAGLGLNFVGVNFYDGQGFMVTKKRNVKSAKQLDGAAICVQPGTTTELNLADYFRANNMKFKPVVIEKLEEVLKCLLRRPLRCLHHRCFRVDRRARLPGGELGRSCYLTRSYLQRTLWPGGAPWRRPLVRHRPVVAVRDDRSRRAGNHLEEYRPASAKAPIR